MRILGIETSADDTGIALIEAEGEGKGFRFKVLGNKVATQTIHEEYGGIFPAMAKQEHKRNLPVLLETVITQAFGTSAQPDIDCIAVTVGPGLEPCLWSGITFAQELAARWNVPVVPANHMEGHIVMSLVHHEGVRSQVLGVSSRTYSLEPITYPALALLISGGHTELISMKKFGSYEYIGRTRDDAVGEAFDKVARLLGLAYPGGPHISRLALAARKARAASPRGFKLPRPMMNEDNFDFSFSGLKTAVARELQKWQGKTLPFEVKKQIAREFEDAATDVLVYKTLRAVEEFGASTVIVGGGVSANKHIRSELASKLEAISSKLLVCPPEFSTDNGLMIALTGYFHATRGEFADPSALKANGKLALSDTTGR